MLLSTSRRSLARVAASRLTSASAAAGASVVARSPAAAAVSVSASTRPAQPARLFSGSAIAANKTDMFCYQCEQTENGTGCTTGGVCGKTPETASLQDLLVHVLKGISMYAHRARQLDASASDPAADKFMLAAMFSTLTNVSFDAARFHVWIKDALVHRNNVQALYEKTCAAKGVKAENLSGTLAAFVPDLKNEDKLMEQADSISIPMRQNQLGKTITGLQELISYGLKGTCAYADHALILGRESDAAFAAIHQAMNLLTNPNPSVGDLLGGALAVGAANVGVLEMLEEAEIQRYGAPSPTSVNVNAVAGKCILVSGHDLRDLEEVLKQTEGKEINVFTHGELLPGHGYPNLRKYKHLVGNYGGAWQLQKFDFASFPGPIVMTTNCLIEPKKSYADRIYTRSVVSWPGIKHLDGYDMSAVVAKALECKGFAKSEERKEITVGFGKNFILNMAGDIVNLVKAGKISHFFVIGGCDGAESERSYFRDLADNTPKDSVILTMGCGKYRFNKHDLGTVGDTGIPRVLDLGQCNDSFAAAQIGLALAAAFDTDINHLPLTLAVSWFEQKAVAVLLSLLHLGVQNIRLGPNLPAFVTPEVLAVLVENFKLHTIFEHADIKDEVKLMMAARS